MTRNQFKVVTHIPIAGPIIKVLIDGAPDISNSFVLEDASYGEDSGWLAFVRTYLKQHPDEYPTKKLIQEIRAEWKKQNR